MGPIAEPARMAAPLVGLQLEGDEALGALDTIMELPGLERAFLRRRISPFGTAERVSAIIHACSRSGPRSPSVRATQVAANGCGRPNLPTARRWRA
jgi:hypothetical protein